MPTIARVLLPLALCALVPACSASGGSSAGPSANAADSSPAAVDPSSVVVESAAAPSGGAASPSAAPASSGPAAVAPAPGGRSVITFKGKLSGSMTATACQGGIAQLAVDIDGQKSSFAGIIDADDFTFVAPNSAGYTLAKGAAKPKVGNSGTTFTVHDTKLIGVLSNDTVTASGSVTCP